MQFFIDPKVALGIKLQEVLYILMGVVALYTGIKTLFEKEHKSRVLTAVFWIALGVVMVFGHWIPSIVSGLIVVVMAIPAMFRMVKPGASNSVSKEYTRVAWDKIGNKIFIPTLSMGIFAIIFAIFTKISPLVGVGVGVIVAMIVLMLFSKDNKPKVFFDDSKRLLDTVGPLSMLPMLLASLGAIFTAAGVGPVITSIFSAVIPKGNVNIAIIVFALATVIFTIIMGNVFAAITVLIVGIGGPFILAYGANPTVIGMLALSCGACGTLITPMAANFNLVPVAILNMKGRYNVIKNQLLPAGLLLIFQICYMLIAK